MNSDKEPPMGNLSEAERRNAWDYHKAADALFHMRLQAFFASQAALLVPIVLFYVNQSKITEFYNLSRFICVAAAAVCLVFGVVMWLLVKRIEFLKRHYLIRDLIYAEYLSGEPLGGNFDEAEVRKKRGKVRSVWVIPIVLPLIFIFLWAALFYFSLKIEPKA